MLDIDPQTFRPRYEDALKVAVNRHDLSVINIYDERDRTLPDVGLLPVRDNETGRIVYVDTSRRSVREVSIRTDQDYVKSLVALFQTRA